MYKTPILSLFRDPFVHTILHNCCLTLHPSPFIENFPLYCSPSVFRGIFLAMRDVYENYRQKSLLPLFASACRSRPRDRLTAL